MSAANLSWGAAWTLARRDLSARFRGLRLLLACLFLGVGALAATASLTHAVTQGLATHGRAILGGDVQVAVWQRDVSGGEKAALGAYGTLSSGTRMQAMASAGEASAVPIELKAVDARWPLVGALVLADGARVGAPPSGGAWVSPGAAARLGLAAGDHFRIAGKDLRVSGIIADEPDRLGEGFTLGPVVIVGSAFPEQAGLIAPGSMYRTKLRLACARACDTGAIAAAMKAHFPSAGLEIRSRERAAPGADTFLARMGDFLVLVGLAALMIAGIGIGGGTASYLEARAGAIATLKVLGATSGDIARIYLLQILAAACVGSVAGVIGGLALMPVLAHALAGMLPLDGGFDVDVAGLARACVWGVLVALVFAASPLAAARAFPAMALMRAHVASPGGWAARFGRPEVMWPVGLGLAAIIALAFAGASQPIVTAYFLAGAAAIFAMLSALGWAIRAGAARLPRPRGVWARMALANLHRPGAQTGRLVTALGFGLSSFVLLAVVETSLDGNIAARVPMRAPDYFVVDLQPDRLAMFERLVQGAAPGSRVRSVPALRGAILAYGPAGQQTRVADIAKIPEDAWALKGERGLTFSDDVPEGNVVTQGAWWPRGYAGPPLVSVDEKLARAVGLHLGDTITIGLLGVERQARIASFRRIDWDSFGFNYVLVFSPNALADAPYKLAATIILPAHGAGQKAALLHALVQGLPGSSVIEVGPILRDARALLEQMGRAILAAASVAVLAGIAVLIGAIAAARAARQYDMVILRVLGATAGQMLWLGVAEYAVLACVLAGVALALGAGLGWVIVVQLFGFAFMPDWDWVLAVLGAGLAVVLGVALAGAVGLLSASPARVLRNL